MKARGHRLSVGGFAALAAAGAAAALPACGESEETLTTAEIAPVYPHDDQEHQIASLHVWVLGGGGQAADAGAGPSLPPSGPRASTLCGNLVGQALSPYDGALERIADRVFLRGGEDEAPVVDIPPGEFAVYVEAVDHLGVSRLAGCDEVTVDEGARGEVAIELEIELRRPGTFECGDAAVEDGAPCDSGERCTVEATCSDGECAGGRERDCDFVADACHAGECSEDVGCRAVALADGTPCQIDSLCTVGDVCEDGACVGTDRDCAEEVGPCDVPACDEEVGCFADGTLPVGSECDDGLFCTVETTCSSLGNCIGGAPRDCSEEVGQCEIPACSEEDGCHVDSFEDEGVACDDGDNCTVSECDGSGECVSEPLDCEEELEAELDICEAAVCDDDEGCVSDGAAEEGAECDATGDPCTEDVGACTGDGVGEEHCEAEALDPPPSECE